MLLPFPLSANLEGELSKTNPFVKLMRSRVAAVMLFLVALLQPVESFANLCKMDTALTCQDSTPCKTYDSVSVCLAGVTPLPAGAVQTSQTCWDARTAYTCVAVPEINDTCGPLRERNECGIINSTCVDYIPGFSTCNVFNDTYQCQTGGGLATLNTDCSGQSYCSNGTCFTKKDGPNNALPKVVAAMETARQSGFYKDDASQTVFTGVPQWCGQNTLGLADCCKPDSKGMSFTDALLVTELIKGGWNAWVRDVIGSPYTFDTLFDSASGYVTKAIDGMAEVVNEKVTTDASLSVTQPDTTASAVTAPPGAGVGGAIGGAIGGQGGSSLVADNGGNAQFTAVGASAGYVVGSVVGSVAGAAAYAAVTTIGAAGVSATGSAIMAGGQAWSAICWVCLIVMAIIMLIMALLACEEEEIKTQMKLGANLCHYIGSHCKTKTIAGMCVTMEQGHCCFNSKLAKIVQEQGRPQIGKEWGTPQNPECSGFTIQQLQGLDFSQMDFSEFMQDVRAQAAVDVEKIKQDIANRIDAFYGPTGAPPVMNGVVPAPTGGVPVPLVVVQEEPTIPGPRAMPACTVSDWIKSPVQPADTQSTGTITVSSCLTPDGLIDWAYVGSCPVLQNQQAVDTMIDVNGNTTFTVSVPNECVDSVTTPSNMPTYTNMWKGRVMDTPAGRFIGTVEKLW